MARSSFQAGVTGSRASPGRSLDPRLKPRACGSGLVTRERDRAVGKPLIVWIEGDVAESRAARCPAICRGRRPRIQRRHRAAVNAVADRPGPAVAPVSGFPLWHHSAARRGVVLCRVDNVCTPSHRRASVYETDARRRTRRNRPDLAFPYFDGWGNWHLTFGLTPA